MPFLFQQPQAEAATQAEEAEEAAAQAAQAAQAEEAPGYYAQAEELSEADAVYYARAAAAAQAEADYYARIANEGLEEYAADAEGEGVEEHAAEAATEGHDEEAAEAATEGHDEEAAEADLQGFEGEAEEAPEVLPHYEEAMTELAEMLGEPTIGEFDDHAEEGNGLLASEMEDGLTSWLNQFSATDTAELDDNENPEGNNDYPEDMQGDEGGLEAEEKALEAEEAELEDRRNFLESIPEGDEAEGDADTEAPSDEAFPGVSMAVNKRCEHSIEKDAAPEKNEEGEGEAPTDMARHPWDGKPLPTDAEEAPEEEAAEATAEEAPEEKEAPEAQGEICSS